MRRSERRYRASWRALAVAVALAALSSLGVGAAAPASGGHPAVLRVAIDENYPPFVMRDPSGALDGYLVDEWKLWSRKTGVPVQLMASSWDLAQQRMRQGQADVIDTIFETPERDRTLDFSRPYVQIPVSIYTSSSLSGIGDIEALRGFQVAVKAGDACADKLRQNGVDDLQLYPDYADIVQAAAEGRVHVFCMDQPPANYLIYRAHAQGRIREAFALYGGDFHRAVHKGDRATLGLVEQGFGAMSAGELRDLHEKWMGRSLEGPGQRRLWFGLLGAAAVIALLVGFVVVLRLIIKVRTADLVSTRNKLQATLDALPDLLFELDLDGRYHDFHSPRAELLAVSPRDIVGRTMRELLPADVAEAGMAALRAALVDGYGIGEYQLDFPDGRHWFEFTVSRKAMAPGDMPHFIVLSRDITDRKQAEDRIRYLANFDALTGLPNRVQVSDHLRYAIGLARRGAQSLAVLFLDLDHFKDINDTLGHSVGDALLVDLSRRLRGALREEDTLARLGGDEFVVVLAEVDNTGAANVAQKLLAAAEMPFRSEARDLIVTASIGIAMYPEDGGDLESLLKNADSAMYRAKRDGRNSYAFYTAEMQRDASRHLQLVNALRRAIERDELSIHYQPQVTMADARLVGAEALLRWNSAELGAVSPNEFIPVAENSGLIMLVGEWVLRQAARQLRAWIDGGLGPLVVAVNLSAMQFRHPALPELVTRVLEEEQLPPEYLELELTESVMMREPQRAVDIMNDIHDRGVRMSIDDFGTGYSSLSQLKKFKVYKLKIDKSFVRDISTDQEDRSIVRAIIDLAKNLNMRTIAEGVETVEQLDFLREHGCDEMQGYYCGRPVDAAAFASQFLRREAVDETAR